MNNAIIPRSYAVDGPGTAAIINDAQAERDDTLRGTLFESPQQQARRLRLAPPVEPFYSDFERSLWI